MTIRRAAKSLALLLAAGCLAASLGAWADEGSGSAPWKIRPVEQWSPEDAKLVLADSPWAGSVQPQIVRDLSPDERRQSGNYEADIGHGVGLAGINIFNPTRMKEAIAKAHAKPDPGSFYVRWASASTVRAAEKKLGDLDAPATDDKYYTIVVYDIPTPSRMNIESELKGIASLKREHKKDIKPSRVIVVRKDETLADVIYQFRRSEEITNKDSYVGFAAQIERLVLWQVFYPQQMQVQGRLEL
jgi:hypothetical protein